MSKLNSFEKSSTNSIRSSYFQTEFTSLQRSDGSSGDDLGAVSKTSNSSSVEDKSERRRNISRNSLTKKVNISVQTGRSIIGQEDSLTRERKRWTRPPGVGQASTSEGRNTLVHACHFKGSSSEDDSKPYVPLRRGEPGEYVIAADIYQNRKDYTNDKPMEGGSSDQSLPQLSEQSEFPRVISPSSASSLTSRPLEWDSGADVGYFQNFGTVSKNHFSSTMDRTVAMECRTGMLTRSDPEGISSSKKGTTAISAIGLPTAESTVINFNSTETSLSKGNNTTNKSHGVKQKYHPLFPEVIIQYKGNISDSSNEGYLSHKDRFNDPLNDSKLKKISSSLENVNKIKYVEGQAATFPRSQSQSDINCQLDYNSHLLKTINPPQSVSSSSVATVITGNSKKISKSIQTSYLKNNIGIQYSLNGSSFQKIEENSFKQNRSSTLDSVQLSADDRVNSFEYLPGHVYENASKSDSREFWESTKGASLQNDVERGVRIIEEFIQGSNANNTIKKKELLHRVVEKLIETDYPEDVELLKTAPQRCSTRRSQNREEVLGESSSEVIQDAGTKALSDTTTLSGQSTSALQTTSDSTKSSEPSIPRPVIKSQGSGSSKRVEKQVRKDRSTDLSSESKSDWKEPQTRAEKLYEMKKKGVNREDNQLIDFVNSERENQIDWIVKEINHLSNLKTLLEKHERLRKNLNRLKTAKSRSDLSPSKQNLVRPVGFKRRSQFIPSINRTTERNINPNRRTNFGASNEDAGWDSHNYETNHARKSHRTVSSETREEPVKESAKPLAYTITFDPEVKVQKSYKPEVRPIIADRQTLEKESRTRVREAFKQPSLQDCLVSKRPDIVSRAEMRRQTLAELAAIRQVRENNRPAVLAAALNCETAASGLPPVSLVKRIVSQKEMREQTERKYRRTFEVRKKISDQKLKETQKSNKLMADIFNKRLQLLTLKGHTNLSNSIDVISTM